MNFLILCLTALGLSMDAFAVSITDGMCLNKVRVQDAVKISLYFGGFQGMMPLLGYLGGKNFAAYVQKFDHWIALFLLGFIGGKMVVEAIHEILHPSICPLVHSVSTKQLLLQAIATSIDALAIGVGFAVMNVPIVFASGIIALVTFFCCFLGAYLGKVFGELFKQKAEIFGGLILVFLGIKIFTEHIFA